MIKGFEVIRALRKRQACAFNAIGDILGETRLVEDTFGLGASALTEVVSFLGQQLELKAA